METFLEYEKEHLKKLRRLAPECMVLLKSNGDFPLSAPEKLALYGNGARRTIKGGTGSGDVNSRYIVTVERGLVRSGFTITTKDWLDAYDRVCEDAHKKFIEEIKEKARREHKFAAVAGMGAVMAEPEYELPLDGDGEIAVYVLSRICGEGNDRKSGKGDFELSTTEIRDILALKEKYKKFILVLNVGGIIDLTPVQGVENILLLGQLGAVTGLAFADVLLGKSYPSGKLSATWAAYADYPTIGTSREWNDSAYREGIYVGYRYFDSVEKAPLYPFGYGISYTTFEIGETSVAASETAVTVKAKVKNTGKRAGKEVVQLYVSSPAGRLDQPYQAFAASAKTEELAPDEESEVTLNFDLKDLASFDTENAAYLLEKGNYLLRVGSSSRETRIAAVLAVKKEITVKKVRHIGGETDLTDWKPAPRAAEKLPKGIPTITIQADAFSEEEIDSSELSDEAKRFVAGLSDEALCDLVIGHYGNGIGFASVVGSASSRVAGAAGETTDKVKGVPVLVMADGPAGLRLSRDYTRDKKGGARAAGDTLPAGVSDFLNPVAQAFLKNTSKPKGTLLHQYCTAIPIGTALAQSFSEKVCEICGDIVGDEMERFGIHLWLAPGMNLQRDPLCGRNFEYYSEDPVLTGLMAAAITRGVQTHAGRGTTIKHFCCNNQETNRFQNNSAVSERTLRELYLRGFEIAVKRSHPVAIMTSYNLVNGIHTAEREDLLKTVLRSEWGYDGLVMSDWTIAQMYDKTGNYRQAKAAPSVKAGNDIFMPGCKGDYNDVLSALKGKNPDCRLGREEVELCAGRVVETAWRLTRAID